MKMETPPAEESLDVAIEEIKMEDSFFPFLSDDYNQSVTTACTSYKKQISSGISDHPSDLEADSMPESQMELTEVRRTINVIYVHKI